ncbi:aldehyde dehydrogenase family protein [Sinorhizobium meliloti]|uniref:aldehyde dehydrogenase family protein n=1 Tax=Rhizobium meliloti TaxID=382 RepID=UPI003D64C87E
MTQALPRVTYSNIGVDFSPVHDYLDGLIPEFEKNVLGRVWKTPFANGKAENTPSPIDPSISLGSFQISTSEDILAAISAARKGAKVWNATSYEERLEFAARWKDVLEQEKYRLGLAALYEIGKSRLEAIGEAEEAVDMLDYYPSELRNNNGYRRPMNQLVDRETAESVLRPYGAFAVIAPFNFPVALSIGMIVGALLGGNSVVYKPSPACQLTGLLIAETIRKAGLPEGVFNVVLGGAEVGQLLSTNKGIDGVAFTGSHKTGMSIFRHMAVQPWMKPVIAEMGGKNPAYVTKNADIDRAAQGVVRSAFGLQGQKCSACSVVYVDNAVKDEFIKRAKEFASKLVIGDPRKRETFMGPLYNDGTVRRFTSAVEQIKKEGTVHFGGNRLEGFPSNYFAPAIVEASGPSNLTREEMFMPFVVVRGVDNLEAGLAEGNDVAYGLAAGVFTKDEAELNYFLNTAEAGVLYANRASGATTGAWPGAQPFCGWKGTGVSGKGGLGSYFLPQFMREQSHTIMTK